MTAESNTAFHLRWTAALGVAELVGIGTTAAIAVALLGAIGEPDTLPEQLLTYFAILAGGAVEGLALGTAQWLLLRRRLPRLRAREWVGATTALAVAGWAIGMFGPTFFATAGASTPEVEAPPLGLILAAAAAIGAGAGVLFGGVQWLVLRQHARGAGRWIGVNALGWTPAMALIFLGAGLPSEDTPGAVAVLMGAGGALLGGLSLGAITGFVARSLRPWVDPAWRLDGRVVVVTGGTSGIGRETARQLAEHGATVVLPVRTPAAGEATAARIREEVPGAELHVVACDLASLASTAAAGRSIAARWPVLTGLVHDAGVVPAEETRTVDGHELTFSVDVLAPHLLTRLLADALQGGRLVQLAGMAHRKGELDLERLPRSGPYDAMAVNKACQLARVLTVKEGARRLPRIQWHAVHPGGVLTRAQAGLPLVVRLLLHTLMRPGFVRAELGAAPVVRLIADPAVTGSGSHWTRFRAAPASDAARDPDLAKELWDRLDRLVDPLC